MIPWRVLYTMWVLCYKDIVVVVSKIQLQKKKWAQKWMEINAIKAKGGGPTLSSQCHKNFHIFLKTSLSNAVRSMKSFPFCHHARGFWWYYLIETLCCQKNRFLSENCQWENTSVLTLVHVGERQEGLCRKQQRLKAEDGISQKICGHISCPPPSLSFHLPLLALHDRPAGRDKGHQHLNEASSWGAHREPGQPSGLREASDFNLILQFMYNF